MVNVRIVTVQTATDEPMTGTPSQIEWAEQILPSVNAEFNRVAKAFEAVAAKQSEKAQLDTRAVLAILEEKRAEALAHTSAGYFIKDWRELGDQVRSMIVRDPRFQSIQSRRKPRPSMTTQSGGNA